MKPKTVLPSNLGIVIKIPSLTWAFLTEIISFADTAWRNLGRPNPGLDLI
jgi:hypothetical protein